MNKTQLFIAAAVAVFVVLVFAIFMIWRRHRPVKYNTDHFLERWQTLQKRLRDKTQWGEAVIEADNLLDEALKKRRIRGRNMGARLVKAQRLFSDNDGLWYGHKLRSKIDADPTTKLKNIEVKQALLGIRQALKDLGALL